jgi:hypothetical protein
MSNVRVLFEMNASGYAIPATKRGKEVLAV